MVDYQILMMRKYHREDKSMENAIEIKLKGNYHKSEKFYKMLENRKEQYSIKGVNEKYWVDFEQYSGKNESSLFQYKSAVKRFIDIIDKDILTINTGDLEDYLDRFEGKTKDNQSRYIKSFLMFNIDNNIDIALKYTDEELLLSLIPDEYKIIVGLLMDKQNNRSDL
jgi:hypothetical protein